MTHFNQGPGRDTHVDSTEGLKTVWLGGNPVLQSVVDKMKGQPESQDEGRKNRKGGAWKTEWQEP
eukprot:9236589-Prorocentrum_lima.AAC.1